MDSQNPPSDPSQSTDTSHTETPASSPPPSQTPPQQTPPSETPPPSSPPVSPEIPPSEPSSKPAIPPLNTPPTSPSDQSAPPSGGKHKLFLPILGLIILAIGFVFLGLWYFRSQEPQTTAQATDPEPSFAVTTQKLVVGTDPTYPPMESLENGKLTGYDIDLANFIAKEIGAQVEFKQIVFDDLFPALEKKDIDMIISTVTVTSERKQKYDFSDTYLQGGQVILIKKDNAAITTTADLNGKKIGVQKGTTIETEALKYTPDKQVIRYPDFVQATAALVKGDVDAIFTDLPSAKSIIVENPTLKIANDPFTQEYYAVVFRKGDPQINKINKALSSLKVKGILADLKQKWIDP